MRKTGSKMLDDPKLYEKCTLHGKTHRQSILQVQIPYMHAFHVILTIASQNISQMVNNVCARKFPTIIKVLVNTLVFNVFNRNFRYKSV